MEYTNLLDTSLNLHGDDSNIQEGARNFIEFVGKIPAKHSKADQDHETRGLLEEIKRVSDENKKLTEELTVICESYNALRNQVMEYVSKNNRETAESNGSKKRKAESIVTNYNEGACSSSDEDSSKKPKEDHQIKQKISKVYVPTEATDTSLIVRDGYQWRKYGQKVTKDNPFPRAYFKCSFAPSCPVKKKVQRSVENPSLVVATYEGDHNHKIEETSSMTTQSHHATLGSVSCLTNSNTSSSRTITLDLTKPNPNVEGKIPIRGGLETSNLQKSLVEQMASSLTNDSNFRAALAAAISGRILQPK